MLTKLADVGRSLAKKFTFILIDSWFRQIYRLRAGGLRIMYDIDFDKKEVYVFDLLIFLTI
jgi:mRNA-degrading endonuclease RelE of RelBE toxin-antitoxin system